MISIINAFAIKGSAAAEDRGVDFVWFGSGCSTDAEHIENSGNPNLNFDVLRRLFRKSPKLSCQKVFFP